MTAEDASVARKVVDLNHVRPQDREEIWRLVSAPNFEMGNLPDRISAYGVAYYLGPVTLTRSRHPRQTLIRTADRIRFDGADDIFCSVELDAACGASLGETDCDIGPGQVTLWDMGRPSEKYSQAGETLCIRIERDAWRRAAGGDPAIHGLTLGSLGPLFRDHLLSLERIVAGDPEHASPSLGYATLQLLAACVRPEPRDGADMLSRPKVVSLLMGRAERYIRANLGEPGLSPDEIARAVGVSRSSLYSLMEDAGGVAAFIRRHRLEAAHAMLMKQEAARVGEIALALGFGGQTQFNRAFKKHYGYAPGDVRASRS